MTLLCLKCLLANAERLTGWTCQVFLVDDGSSDGTGSRVRAAFRQVKVIEGDGNLFWAKGMELAWKTAVAEGDWDAYLWLNDDTVLYDDALAKLFSLDDGCSIIVGDLQDSAGKIVYGLREGGLFTGNCVFVPQAVYGRLGMLCAGFAHAWADSDYALLAQRKGVNVIAGGVVGTVEGHPNRPSLKGLSFKERVRMLRDPKGWHVHDLWLYRRRNWGIMAAMVSCVHLVLHVMWGER